MVLHTFVMEVSELHQQCLLILLKSLTKTIIFPLSTQLDP